MSDRKQGERLGVSPPSHDTDFETADERGSTRIGERIRVCSMDYLAHEGMARSLIIWPTLTAKDLTRPVRTRMPGGVGGAQPKG